MSPRIPACLARRSATAVLAPAMRLLPLLIVALSAACSSSTGTGTPPADVVGSWRYAGQTDPPGTTYAGTLTISTQSGRDVSGTLVVTERDPNGVLTQLSAVVSGRVLSATSIDFDAAIAGVDRRHLGTIGGDSIAGSWADYSGEAIVASGTFSAARSAAP